MIAETSKQKKVTKDKPSGGNWNGCHNGNCQCGTIFGHDGTVYIGTALGPLHINDVDPVPTRTQQMFNARLFINSKKMYLLLKDMLEKDSMNDAQKKKARLLIREIEGEIKKRKTKDVRHFEKELKSLVPKA